MKRKGRADGRVEVKITLPDGKRKSFYGSTRAEAKFLAERYKAQNIYGYLPGEIRSRTVKDWSEEWIDAYVRGTIRDNSFETGYASPLRLYILPRFGNAYLISITQLDVQKFLNEMSAVYTRDTVKKLRTCLSRMFEAGIANHICRENPVKGTRIAAPSLRPEKRFYNKETVQKILSFEHPHTYLLRLLLECGLRREELFGLQWNDVRADGIHIIRVVPTVRGQPVVQPPKSRASCRVVPISDDLYQTLKNVRKALDIKKGTEFICTESKTGGLMNPHHFDRSRLAPFYKAFCAANDLEDFPVLSPHEHRHTCGTLMYRDTRDIYKVMTYLGHSSVEVTASVYVHPDSEKGISYKDFIRRK